MVRILHRILAGHGEPGDVEKLVNVANNIEGRTICALGEAAAWPVQSFVKHFYAEFDYYNKHKHSIVMKG
jgi:NADH-quinone oxidoreductase subunit F